MATEPFEHDQIEVNGIGVHTVSAGKGPLVVFCHGFPESWYSWRHQLPAVAEAGFRAMALDMRGYGRTGAPAAVHAYSMSHIVADVVGVVAAAGAEQAVVVGHDWGAVAAWYSALMRPDVFRAVAALSVPYIPPIPALPDGMTINDVMRQAAGEREYYRLFFQEPGVAEADLEADVDHSLRAFLYTLSGDIVADGVPFEWLGWLFPEGARFCRAAHPARRAAVVAHRRRPGVLCLRVLPHRVPRRSQLVPQHPGATDDPGPVRRRGDQPTRAVPGRGIRPDRRETPRKRWPTCPPRCRGCAT